jgi:hypothetical protein
MNTIGAEINVYNYAKSNYQRTLSASDLCMRVSHQTLICDDEKEWILPHLDLVS